MPPAAAAATESFPAYFGSAAWLHEVLRQTPSWLASMVVHMVVLLLLALWYLPEQRAAGMRELVIAPYDSQREELDQLYEPLEDLNLEVAPTELFEVETSLAPESLEVASVDDVASAVAKIELTDMGVIPAPRSELLTDIGGFTGQAFTGRGEEARRQLVLARGGSVASERAVAAALRWLAEHQMPDGGWSFAHHHAPQCDGRCRHPGNSADARNAATGLALLPFLGAGQTYRRGQYRRTVQNGLHFLVRQMRVGSMGGSLHEGDRGNMYSHGIAAIALTEAYGMTQDRGLRGPAQEAINFIVHAQDPVGGGWRYDPRQPGDTSVVGWQVMALKSGHLGYLQVPPVTVQNASRFLDSVQYDDGTRYGYTSASGGSQATTAIGVLSRMYLGWDRDHPTLEYGVRRLSEWGPSEHNFYYNYYATQAMAHWDGELWNRWNLEMRDYLVETQATEGHEAGSWFFPSSEGSADHGLGPGGRLYFTSMATMILEVYYRHLPLYTRHGVETEFPID